jgi:hypothetical protein
MRYQPTLLESTDEIWSLIADARAYDAAHARGVRGIIDTGRLGLPRAWHQYRVARRAQIVADAAERIFADWSADQRTYFLDHSHTTQRGFALLAFTTAPSRAILDAVHDALIDKCEAQRARQWRTDNLAK